MINAHLPFIFWKPLFVNDSVIRCNILLAIDAGPRIFWFVRFLKTEYFEDCSQIPESHRLTNFSPVLCSYRNQSFFLQSKTNDWFLYETQHWVEMSWNRWKQANKQNEIQTRKIRSNYRSKDMPSYSRYRCIFRTHSNIYDGVFLQKHLTAKSH